MKQTSLAAVSGFELKSKATRERIFLAQMEQVLPSAALVALITPHVPARGAKGDRPPLATGAMLRIHFMQQWFGPSNPAMEEALYDVPLYRRFASLDIGAEHLPDGSIILRFRHLLEQHGLAARLFEKVGGILAARGLLLKVGTAVEVAPFSRTSYRLDQRSPQCKEPVRHTQ